MLRSVVTTGSYTIDKYSRSYPSPLVRTQSQDLGATQPDWQHFSNPVITLTLDVKKSMDNIFESVRLRVLWNMDMGHDRVEREVTMEDLDLLSFSQTPSQIHPGQGPPLKAVYRGAVVGIRYQYPFSAPATSPASYRRFQVNFSSASDAAQFIEAIRPVCPCKENSGPPAPPASTNRPPIPPLAPMQPLPAHTALTRYNTSAVQGSSMPPPSVGALKSETQGSSQELPTTVPRFPPHMSSDLSLAPSSDPAPPTPVPALPSSYPAPSLGSSQLVPDACLSQITGQSGSGITAPSSSLPALSQLPSTVSTLAPEPTPPTSTATQRDDELEKQAREAFLESLREVPELYSLTRRELENLVSVVVREPGFPKLVGSHLFIRSLFSSSRCLRAGIGSVTERITLFTLSPCFR
ncbi:hypothetical protein EI94DRAFT_1713558 [Lactarius quietus]|nr:hypothetical protein EI94DRAFT_1713558 [Lactarius quietus]